MKRIVASTCVLAVGATGAYAVNSYNLARAETGKPWTVDVAVRGIYDSNPYNLSDVQAGPKDSFGFWVKPQFQASIHKDQLTVGARYTYDARYYERFSQADQSHEIEGGLEYKFSPKTVVSVSDSFAYSDLPEVLEPNNFASRTSGTAFRNRSQFDLTQMLTRESGISLGYLGYIYDYRDADRVGSRSALLDRYENQFSTEYFQQVLPTWTAALGYKFSMTDFTGNDHLSVGGPSSYSRNSRSHFIYAGLTHELTSTLKVQGQVGGMYTLYSSFSGRDDWSPYAQLRGVYTYAPDSTLEFGLMHQISVTDLAGDLDAQGTPTLSQESTYLFLDLKHKLTANLFANLSSQFQFSDFVGGRNDNGSEKYSYVAPVLEYRFAPAPIRWSVEVGYSYQFLTSDAPARDYDRHSVFAGLKGSY